MTVADDPGGLVLGIFDGMFESYINDTHAFGNLGVYFAPP